MAGEPRRESGNIGLTDDILTDKTRDTSSQQEAQYAVVDARRPPIAACDRRPGKSFPPPTRPMRSVNEPQTSQEQGGDTQDVLSTTS